MAWWAWRDDDGNSAAWRRGGSEGRYPCSVVWRAAGVASDMQRTKASLASRHKARDTGAILVWRINPAAAYGSQASSILLKSSIKYLAYRRLIEKDIGRLCNLELCEMPKAADSCDLLQPASACESWLAEGRVGIYWPEEGLKAGRQAKRSEGGVKAARK